MVYAVLVASALLIEFALNIVLGSLPLALSADGVSPANVVLVLGMSSVAALVASIPAGALADRFGRLPVIRTAAVACGLSMVGLAYAHTPLLAMACMALRGVAVTAYVTAEFAYASAIAAPGRAVSQTATLGMVGNLTFATAPAVGYWLWQCGIGREQYLGGAALAFVGAVVLVRLPREVGRRVRRSRRIIMRSAWLPAIAFLVACTLQGGVNGSLAVLTFHQRGIANGALLFTCMALTTFGLRYGSGRLVDRFGPRAIAVPTAAAQCVGAFLAAHATTPLQVGLAGLALGTAWSAVVPVGIGLLFERSSRGTRGVAMGSYNLAFSIGATGGALLAALFVTVGGGYTVAMTVCAFAALLTLPWVLSTTANTRSPASRPFAPSFGTKGPA
jgi:MFS family permease